MAPRLLAIDSSTEELAVSIAAGAQHWTRVVPGGAHASSRMLALVLEGLSECGIGAQLLDAVAFGAGPGAFTGLRCACAVAQGLAFGAGIPVIAVDSLMVVAEDACDALGCRDGDTLWAASDARMDEVYAASYRRSGGRWQVESAPALYTLDALSARWRARPPSAVAGSAVQAFAQRLPWGQAATRARVQDRAAALLRLALQMWADGKGIDPAQAAPLYLRDKVALTTAERAAARVSSESRGG